MQKSTIARVNIGCGATPTPGWINLDNSLTVRIANGPFSWLLRSRPQFYDAIKRAGIRYGTATRIPLADNSVEVVYTSHMVEHLDRADAADFLNEANRILVPGGRVRVVVPDLLRKVEEYRRDGDADALIDGLLMSVHRPRRLLDSIWERLVGFRDHRWMYDERSLAKLIAEAGFSQVVAFPPGETGIRNPEPLDLRERWDESIYLEGVAG